MDDQEGKTPKQILTQSEVAALSLRYIKGVDKWNRMCNGIASDLVRYEEGILHLRIGNTEQRMSSSHETAELFARSWVRYNPELKNAKGFVATFYRSRSTGFMMKADAAMKQDLAALVRDLMPSAKQEQELLNIFSGLLIDEAV